MSMGEIQFWIIIIVSLGVLMGFIAGYRDPK